MEVKPKKEEAMTERGQSYWEAEDEARKLDRERSWKERYPDAGFSVSGIECVVDCSGLIFSVDGAAEDIKRRYPFAIVNEVAK